ncbi:MAG: tRNA uridine-5-carboxymethylaminomethyl(34) synthesis GTPase MnmE [Candidatus Omnitrophota bacterium]
MRNSTVDTIAAISTSAGDSGIGIVRLSGKGALEIADRIFRSKDGKMPSEYKTYTIHYGWIINVMREEGRGKRDDRAGEIVDEVLLTVMRAPRSFTKEDIVEINCHGGIVATRRVLELCLENGARLAEPGEFTKRAFLNGRIDLAQAEAVLDVIRAKTDSALKIGAEQLKGGLSAGLNRIRKGLVEALSILEANIDFPEEYITPVSRDGLRNRLNNARKEVDSLIIGSRKAKILREGVAAVICGKPNAGKSSLLNALLKRERSIVSPIAGTTRDTIEEIIDIQGIPVRIVDTAGILEPRDLIEKIAVTRSKNQIKNADLVLLLFDNSKRLSREDEFLMKKLRKKAVIPVVNKSDLKGLLDKDKIVKVFGPVIEISAKKTRNIDLLEDAISGMFFQGRLSLVESLWMSNLRHINKATQAQKFIESSLDSLDNSLSPELVSEDIKEALYCFDDILGLRFSEDLLEKIFSEFCIGK